MVPFKFTPVDTKDFIIFSIENSNLSDRTKKFMSIYGNSYPVLTTDNPATAWIIPYENRKEIISFLCDME